MPGRPHIVVAAPATEEFPRQSEGTIAELADGRLLLVWQEFWKGDQGHLDSDFWPARLMAMTSAHGGLTWGEKRVVARPGGDEVSCYSPSLLRLPDGGLLLCFMRYHSVSPISSTGEAWVSHDEGQTFVSLGRGWERRPYGPTNNVIKRLSSGRLLWPISAPAPEAGSVADPWVNGVVYSDDGGATWHEGRNWVALPMRGAMEPHVEELRDGRVLMNMRTQLGAIFHAWSEDRGVTWSLAQTSGLRSPESCPELVRISRTGDLLVVWNNAPYDPGHFSHFGMRTPLTVAISQDEGRTWGHVHDIETDPGRAFSNPACNFTSQGTAVFSYWTSEYLPTGAMRDAPIDLRVAVVDLDWLYED